MVSSGSYSEQREAGLPGLPKGFHWFCSLFRMSPALRIPASSTEARYRMPSKSWDKLGSNKAETAVYPCTRVCLQPNSTHNLCTFHWLTSWQASVLPTGSLGPKAGREPSEAKVELKAFHSFMSVSQPCPDGLHMGFKPSWVFCSGSLGEQPMTPRCLPNSHA